jgi:CDP-glucose 4,6-dehydratase
VEGVVSPSLFWRGKRVFMTGHTGFKGSWLALWLQSLGAVVSGYALAPATRPSLFELAKIGAGMQSILGNVQDLGSLRGAMTAARPDVVFHLAAQSLVRLSYAEPVDTYATNVMGTVNVLEAARACDTVRAMVVITSDKCYENRELDRGYREDEPMGGRDPYSSSKGCAELATAAYRASFFAPGGAHRAAVASARAGNVIGGGDWAADRLVPDIMRAAQAGEPVRIRNPGAIRPWQHVLEPLRGYLLLAERLWEEGGRFAEGWNFGPHDADCQPVSWIVERLAAAWGEGLTAERDRGEHPREARSLRLDSAKAIAHLGWAPRWDLAEALDSIVAWHKAHRDGADMRAVTLAQIDAYMKQDVKETASR